jgi:hypothetical protein
LSSQGREGQWVQHPLALAHLLEAWRALSSEPTYADTPMNPEYLLAKALGRGVEVAAQIPFPKWQELLKTRETLSEAIPAGDGSGVAVYELLPIQEMRGANGAEIEVRVLASDGRRQETVYYFNSKASGPEIAS